jgi:hypothetical protein
MFLAQQIWQVSRYFNFRIQLFSRSQPGSEELKNANEVKGSESISCVCHLLFEDGGSLRYFFSYGWVCTYSQ